jgi:hypothetical protein
LKYLDVHIFVVFWSTFPPKQPLVSERCRDTTARMDLPVEEKVKEVKEVKVTPTPWRRRPRRPLRFLLPTPGWVLLKGERLEMPPELDQREQKESVPRRKAENI